MLDRALTREDGRRVVPRVVRAESPGRELLFEHEVLRPGVRLEVEPAARAEGVRPTEQEAGVVVQAGEHPRVVVAVGLKRKYVNIVNIVSDS